MAFVSSALDTPRGISLASASPDFKTKSNGYAVVFDNMQEIFGFDSNCNTALQLVSLFFSLEKSGSFAGYIVASEDPGLTAVKNVTVQWASPELTRSQSLGGPSWSGYELYGASTPTNAIYEAVVSYTLPNVYGPDSGNCWFVQCIISPWAGLFATQEAQTGSCYDSNKGQYVGCIAQGGTDSRYSCDFSGCPDNHFVAWTEFYPKQLQLQPCSMSVNHGDSMEVDVYNHAAGGGNQYTYDIYAYDFTNGHTCSVPSYYFPDLGTPYYGGYIAERANTLPKFDTFSMAGSIWYSGALRSIWAPYSQPGGWYDSIQMQNNGNANIQISSINSAGTFTQTWKTSKGT